LKDTGFYFDTTNPYRPKFLKSNRAVLSSIADEVRAKPDGGFFITYMGSAVGTTPGRLIETDANFDIIHEWPEDVEGTLNILGEQFSPHGLSIDWKNKFILTSDFVEPISILKPTLGVRHANTLRLWDLDSRKILNTLTIPDVSIQNEYLPPNVQLLTMQQGGGIQDVKFIPNHPEAAALATAVHLGQVWVIYPLRKDANGKQGVVELLYDLGPKARDTVAI
jgi:selenium-binding protein 1